MWRVLALGRLRDASVAVIPRRLVHRISVPVRCRPLPASGCGMRMFATAKRVRSPPALSASELESLTVAQLKEKCRELGLPVSAKNKAALIERLLANQSSTNKPATDQSAAPDPIRANAEAAPAAVLQAVAALAVPAVEPAVVSVPVSASASPAFAVPGVEASPLATAAAAESKPEITAPPAPSPPAAVASGGESPLIYKVSPAHGAASTVQRIGLEWSQFQRFASANKIGEMERSIERVRAFMSSPPASAATTASGGTAVDSYFSGSSDGVSWSQLIIAMYEQTVASAVAANDSDRLFRYYADFCRLPLFATGKTVAPARSVPFSLYRVWLIAFAKSGDWHTYDHAYAHSIAFGTAAPTARRASSSRPFGAADTSSSTKAEALPTAEAVSAYPFDSDTFCTLLDAMLARGEVRRAVRLFAHVQTHNRRMKRALLQLLHQQDMTDGTTSASAAAAISQLKSEYRMRLIRLRRTAVVRMVRDFALNPTEKLAMQRLIAERRKKREIAAAAAAAEQSVLTAATTPVAAAPAAAAVTDYSSERPAASTVTQPSASAAAATPPFTAPVRDSEATPPPAAEAGASNITLEWIQQSPTEHFAPIQAIANQLLVCALRPNAQRPASDSVLSETDMADGDEPLLSSFLTHCAAALKAIPAPASVAASTADAKLSARHKQLIAAPHNALFPATDSAENSVAAGDQNRTIRLWRSNAEWQEAVKVLQHHISAPITGTDDAPKTSESESTESAAKELFSAPDAAAAAAAEREIVLRSLTRFEDDQSEQLGSTSQLAAFSPAAYFTA